jgi:hypothetical protein
MVGALKCGLSKSTPVSTQPWRPEQKENDTSVAHLRIPTHVYGSSEIGQSDAILGRGLSPAIAAHGQLLGQRKQNLPVGVRRLAQTLS